MQTRYVLHSHRVRSPQTNRMDRSSLHVRTVTLRRLYGISHDLQVDDWCRGVNVVYGPNASGKTTLARALRGLLWPSTLEGETAPQLVGQFTVDGARWRVEIDGSRLQYQRDGHRATPPSLPPPEHHDRYHLYLHDLLAAIDGPDAFAERIMQEAVGGYDVESAADTLGFQTVVRRGGRDKERVEETRQALQEVRETQRALQADHRRLDRLRDDLADARRARTRAQALEQAVAVAEARHDRREAKAKCDVFPEAMERIRGDEAEQIEDLLAHKKKAAERRATAEAEIREANKRLAASPLPEDGLPDGYLEQLQASVRALETAEDALADARQARAKAPREEKAAWNRLSVGMDRTPAAAIDLPDMHAIEAHVERVESVQGRRSALDMMEELLTEKNTAAPPAEAARDGIQALIRWLQVPTTDASSAVPWVLLALGVGAALAGGILVGMSGGVPSLATLLLLVLGVLVAGTGLAVRMRATSRSDGEQSVHRRAFSRTELEPPPAWTRDAVVRRLQSLADRWAQAHLEETLKQERERLQTRRAPVEEEREALERERADLADRLGVSPEVDGARSLRWIVERLGRWQSLYDARAAKTSEVEAAQQRVAACREAVEDQVAPYGVDGIDDAARAHGVRSTLEAAQQTVRQARQRRHDARQRRKEAQESYAKATAAVDDLYRRAGVEPGSRAALDALCDQYDAYQQAKTDAREAATRLATKREHLQSLPGYDPAMEEAAPDTLRSRRRAAQAQADKADDLFAEIERIEQRVEDAQAGRDLETAYAEYRAARDTRVRQRKRDVAAAVGKVLADRIQARTRDRDLPEVFRRARALFADVTNGRYALHLDRSERVFRATDHSTGRGLPLKALSSGTQVQLLLCVRMAFVEHQEDGLRLPLVLDETLANSDDAKANAIIDTVGTIAERGRQVVYLTAQQDEVAKWEDRLAAGSTSYRRIALADAQLPTALHGDGPPAAPVRPDVATLPDEVSVHADVPSVIDVPPWTPREPVEALHLWYLIEDVDRLRETLDRGLSTWGPWSYLWNRGAGTGAAGLAVSDPEARRIEAQASAVEAWRRAWHIGRGRPVDRAALEATDAVSNRFLEDVTELAEAHRGNADAVLASLREGAVQYFRSDKVEALRTFFRENDYLDPRDPLPPESLWQHVLADVGGPLEAGTLTPDDLERLFGRFRARTVEAATPQSEPADAGS